MTVKPLFLIKSVSMLTNPNKCTEYFINDGIYAGEHVFSHICPHLTFLI